MAETPGDAERRRHPRFDLLAQVRVRGSQTDLLMELTNISESGALVDMGTLDQPGWIDFGRVLELSIVHPETLDNLEILARVVRLNKDDAGTRLAVEFEQVDDATRPGLAALVAFAKVSARPPPLPKR